MPIDIFDTERPAPDRVFRYPVYERFLWLTALVVGLVALVFLRHVREFLETEGTRGWAVLGAVVFFLLITIWISLRAAVSKVVISPVSLKARVFGQGTQRISWIHIQTVLYKWRPLGHKLIFIGSDGARVTIRSSIRGYDQLMRFIRDSARESAPEQVLDQLEQIFGEEEIPKEKEPEQPEATEGEGPPSDEQEAEEEATEGPPPEQPAPAQAQPASAPPAPEPPAPEPPPPQPEPIEQAPTSTEARAGGESVAEPGARGEAPEEEEAEEPQRKERKRRWWWVFIGR